MKTQIIKVDPLNPEPDKIKDAALVLASGGLVAYPTETVYGLGANAEDAKALLRLYEVKERPKDKPFSLQIALKDDVERFAVDVAPFAWRLIDRFWPGPLTLVLKSKNNRETIGLRMPNNRVALDLLSRAGVAVAAPSANVSSRPAPLTAEDVLRDLDGKIELILDAGKVELGVESTVAEALILPIKILRQGAINRQLLEKISLSKEVLFVCTGNSCRSVMAKYLLENELRVLNKNNVYVSSCGVSAIEGMGVTSFTQSLLRQEGLDAKAHRTARLNKELLRRSDLVLTMTGLHREEILRHYPEFRERVYLVSEFADSGKIDITDPIGLPEEEYRKCFLEIKNLTKKIALKI